MERKETELRRILREYDLRKSKDVVVDSKKVRETIKKSKETLYEEAKGQTISYMEFLYQQAGYIRKGWWLLQGILLLWVWLLLKNTAGPPDENAMIRQVFGIAAPAFGILLFPELWKSRRQRVMEIEGAAYYSLRQIYAARLLLFAVVDIFLLTVFYIGVLSSGIATPWDLLLQFLLPFLVTCSICFRTLYSRYVSTEYAAVVIALFFIVIWSAVIVKEEIYVRITMPVWAFSVCAAIGYFLYTGYRMLYTGGTYWETKLEY